MTNKSNTDKRCTGCSCERPLSLFAKDKSRKDGYGTRCKACRQEYARQYYHVHADEVRQRIRDNRNAAPEKARIATQRWKSLHPEMVRAQRMREAERRREASVALRVEQGKACARCSSAIEINRLVNPRAKLCAACSLNKPPRHKTAEQREAERDKARRRYAQQAELMRAKSREKSERQVESLHDKYVCHLLLKGLPRLKREALPQELIDAKRLQLRLARWTKERLEHADE